MSIRIDDNRPFTDSDREWLTRDGLASSLNRIAVNDRRFGHLSEEEKEVLRQEAASDEEKDRAAEERRKQQEEEDWHPDDVAAVAPLKAAAARERLKSLGLQPEDESLDHMHLQLLEYYDAVRRGTIQPEDDQNPGE